MSPATILLSKKAYLVILVIIFAKIFVQVCYSIGAVNQWHEVFNDVITQNLSSSSSLSAEFTDASLRLDPDQCTVSQHRDTFDNIYNAGIWSRGEVKRHSIEDFYGDAHWPTTRVKKSASGPGSDLGPHTVTSLRIIKETIIKYNIQSMVDIPCGDVNWIFDTFLIDSLPVYAGLDVAAETILVNQKRFMHHKNKLFAFWDATTCEIPKFVLPDNGNEPKSFDLVHTRDVIQHLPLKDGVEFFCNIFRAGSRILITTTYLEEKENINIKSGDWYKNNLELPPFSFPKGECTLTHPKHEDDSTCVYDLEQKWVTDFMNKNCQK